MTDDAVKPSFTDETGDPAVVGLVILMTADGRFGTYMSSPGMDQPSAYPMPSRATLDEITRLLATEWAEPNKEGSPNGE